MPAAAWAMDEGGAAALGDPRRTRRVAPVTVGRRADRPPREAWLTLRWMPLTLLPPRNRAERAALAPVPVAILA